MFTPIHALLAYLVSAVFTKNRRLRLFSLLGGLFPDLDGITLLFNRELYYKYHREIFHPPLAGLAVSLLMFYFYEKKSERRNGTAALFMLGFLVHIVSDMFTTNWPINLLAPIGTLYVSASPALPGSLISGTIAPALSILTIILFSVLVLAEK